MSGDSDVATIAPTIKLKTKDDQIREIDRKKALMSITIKDMVEAITEDVTKAIPLHQISAATLDKVLEWIDEHFDDPLDSDSDSDNEDSCAKCAEDINAWDNKYFEMEREPFFELLMAANFLNIEGLLKTGCKIAAKQIDGKSAEEVRKLWNIECDLDPEVEKRLKKENEWTEK